VSLLRRMVGELPPVEPISTDEQAWQQLSAELARPAPRRTPWLVLAPAAGLAAAAVVAALWFRFSPPPAAPAAVPEQASAAPRVAPAARARPSAEISMARVDALGAPLSVSDGRRATVVHRDFELAAGMGVATSRGEARLSLPGGSLALLEPDSAVGVARLDPDGVELTLASGALFVHAAKLGQGSLAVRAGDYRVVVHGTGFRVERRGGHVSVGLWHGSVEVRSDFDSRGVFLTPGHRLRFDEASGPAGAVARPLGEAEGPGAVEEARLLGIAQAPAPHRPSAPPAAAKIDGPAGPPAAVSADVARCRAESGAPGGEGLRLDLTLADDGQVLAAEAEHAPGTATTPPSTAKLKSCVAEAALHWKLDPPPVALRGMQFVYPIK